MLNVDAKLKHLSAKQIQEVISKYENKEFKLSDIIAEYNIDINPKGLLKILPPIVLDSACEYCGNYLVQKREGRTTYAYGDKDVYCAHCGHIVSSSNWSFEFCKCRGCNNKRQEIEENKRVLIREFYGCIKERFEFDKLSLKDQMMLFYAIKNNRIHNTTILAPMQKQSNFYGNYKEPTNIIRDYNILLEKNIITVSPESSIEAFDKDDFPRKVDLCMATFDINVDFTDEAINDLSDNTYFKIRNYTDEEKVELWKELIYKDAIDKFTDMLEERGLKLYISEKADECFKETLGKISYAQLISLCFRVAKNLSDKVVTGEMNKKFAINAAYMSVTKYYEGAVSKGWKIECSKYEYAGEKLKLFVHNILGKNLSILKEVPSISSLKNCEDAVDIEVYRIKKFKKIDNK